MESNPQSEIGALRELVEYLLRIKVGEALRPDFDEDPKLRVVFDMTGRATQSQIQKRARLDNNAISRAWVSWHSRGLIRKVGRKYEKLWRE